MTPPCTCSILARALSRLRHPDKWCPVVLAAQVERLAALLQEADNLLVEHHEIGFIVDRALGALGHCPACSRHDRIFFRMEAARREAGFNPLMFTTSPGDKWKFRP